MYGINSLIGGLRQPNQQSGDAAKMAAQGLGTEKSPVAAVLDRGEMTVPPKVGAANPGLMAALQRAIYLQGGDPRQHIAGQGKTLNSEGLEYHALTSPSGNPYDYNADTSFEDLPKTMQAPDFPLSKKPKWFIDAYEYDNNENYGWDFEEDIEGTWRDQPGFYDWQSYKSLGPINNNYGSVDEMLNQRYGLDYVQNNGGNGIEALAGITPTGTAEQVLLGRDPEFKKRAELLVDEEVDESKGSGLTNAAMADLFYSRFAGKDISQGVGGGSENALGHFYENFIKSRKIPQVERDGEWVNMLDAGTGEAVEDDIWEQEWNPDESGFLRKMIGLGNVSSGGINDLPDYGITKNSKRETKRIKDNIEES